MPPNRWLGLDDKYNEILTKIKILEIIFLEQQSSKESKIQVEFNLYLALVKQGIVILLLSWWRGDLWWRDGWCEMTGYLLLKVKYK